MICQRCRKEVGEFLFCPFCGKKQIAEKKRSVKGRGNGQGCAYLVSKGNWCVEVTIAYTEDGKRIRKKKQGFATKREALEYVPILKKEVKREKSITLREAFDGFMSESGAGERTKKSYVIAFNHLKPIEHYSLDVLDTQSIQECINNIDMKRQSKAIIRTVLHLSYAYALKKELYDGADKSQRITLTGDNEKREKPSFTMEQLEMIRNDGSIFALTVYCHCFLGFRPSEYMAIKRENIDFEKRTITGVGVKTEAGKSRVVTIPLRIVPYLHKILDANGGFIFKKNHTTYNKKFQKLMETIGLNKEKILFTPHSCRHTYATLLMRSNAPEKLKLQLIGHASADMLAYYQDGKQLADLQAVTDNL